MVISHTSETVKQPAYGMQLVGHTTNAGFVKSVVSTDKYETMNLFCTHTKRNTAYTEIYMNFRSVTLPVLQRCKLYTKCRTIPSF